MLWQQVISDTASYTNNQRNDWGYDAAGNVVSTDNGTTAPDAAGNLTYATRSQTDDLGNGNYRMFDSIISHSLDGDALVRKRTEYRYVEESINEDWTYNDETTTRFNLWSTVLGTMIAELDGDGDLVTSHIYAGSRIAKLEITPSSSNVKYEYTSPQTGTTFQADHSGKGSRLTEYDPLGAEVPKTDPSINSKRLYSDLKPNGKLFTGGSDPFRYDSNCMLDGMPIPCNTLQRLMESGSVMLQIGTGAKAQKIPIDSYALGIYQAREWVNDGKPPRRAPRMKFPNDPPTDTVVTDINQQNGHYNYITVYFDSRLAPASPQNPGRLSEAEHDILANDLNRHLSFRKDCIDFVQALLRTVAINTQRPAYDDVMDVFDKVRKQGGVVVDAAVGRNSHSAEAHGAISGNNATLRVASISFAEGEVMSAARGNMVLAETLHFAAKQGVLTDSELAWAGYQVAWAQGYSVAPPPATNDTEKNSNYFHNTLQFAACSPYQKKK